MLSNSFYWNYIPPTSLLNIDLLTSTTTTTFHNFTLDQVTGKSKGDQIETIYDKRRQHVEDYCQRHAKEVADKHDEFVKSAPSFLFQNNCCLHYNKIAPLVFCVPEKSGSTQTTQVVFDTTISQLKSKFPPGCEALPSKNLIRRGNIKNCITEQFNMEINSTIFDQASQLTEAKFMFFRHPMSRLVSSFHHKRAVCFYFY